jgi:phosphotransferase system enzyme I (PtsI)
MAGDPLYAAILLGLGFQFLSMNVAAIPWVKKVVRSVRMQDAVELADLVMRQPTAVLARQAAVSFMQERFPDLMAEM